MTTTQEFYSALKGKIDLLDIEKIDDKPIKLLKAQIGMLSELFESLSQRISMEIVNNLLVDILKNPNIENGKVYEALVYAWLEKHYVRYIPQFYIEQASCLKASVKGYYADGIIEENGLIFDVKQFGVTLPHLETLRRKLQAKVPKNFYITIEGGKTISTKELQTNFLEKLDDLI